jgi:hypothetical protein
MRGKRETIRKQKNKKSQRPYENTDLLKIRYAGKAGIPRFPRTPLSHGDFFAHHLFPCNASRYIVFGLSIRPRGP